MYINRHRIAKLAELSALERTIQGPERLLREEDVALLVKAAYDDATEPARAEFMTRVKTMPESAWPWSTVQSMAPRGGGGGGGIGGGAKVTFSPNPTLYAPAALILIRGQADSADADLGDQLPTRGTPEAAPWEPLYKALDTWDTKSILAWVGPQGWMNPATTQVPKDTGNGATDGAPQGGGGGVKPANGGDLPVPQPPASGPALTWKHPAVLATGAVVVVVTAGVVIHNVSQSRDRRRLEEALEAQGEQQ